MMLLLHAGSYLTGSVASAFLLFEMIRTMNEKENEIPSPQEKPAVSAGVNLAVIIGTILFPVIGIAMGFTYFRKDSPAAKKAGRNWLILGVLMFIVNIVLVSTMK